MSTHTASGNKIQCKSCSAEKELIGQLKFMLYSEKQLLKLLRRMEKASCTKYLQAGFKGHASATSQHVERLEKIFTLLDEKPTSRKNEAFEVLRSEVLNCIGSDKKKSLQRDLGLIEIAGKIEVFEISKYNAMVSLANDLGIFKIVFLLEEILLEEQEASETFIAIKEDTLKDGMFEEAVHLNASEEPEGELEIVEENNKWI